MPQFELNALKLKHAAGKERAENLLVNLKPGYLANSHCLTLLGQKGAAVRRTRGRAHTHQPTSSPLPQGRAELCRRPGGNTASGLTDQPMRGRAEPQQRLPVNLPELASLFTPCSDLDLRSIWI